MSKPTPSPAVPTPVPDDKVWRIDPAAAIELGRLNGLSRALSAEHALAATQLNNIKLQLETTVKRFRADLAAVGLSGVANVGIATSKDDPHPIGTIFDPKTGAALERPAPKAPPSRQVKRAATRRR